MNLNPDQHLTYDELVRNLVDHADLESERRGHLQACAHCRRQVDNLARRYDRLGRMARELAPQPSRSFRLPDRPATSHRRWQLRLAMAMGLAGALILAITLHGPRFFQSSRPEPQMAAHTVEDDNQLMARVDDLVADALPKAYQKLVAVSEPDLTEDLIDWIVPSIEEEGKELKPHA